MIEITQEEFEEKIEQIISGELTRTKLMKELKMDRITLNNKIQELVVYNPDLYIRFIGKFPYVPREYTHIDWRAMLIDIMKKGYTKSEAAEQYQIHDRTIARKVYEVQKKDPDIVELYRKVSYYRKHKKRLPNEIQKLVDKLPEENVFIGGIYDKKESQLLETEAKYSGELLKGKSTVQASKTCGVQRASKRLNTLYRVKLEQQHKTPNLYEYKLEKQSGREH